MDGTESLRPICYQLHTAPRCLHLNVRARWSQKNLILGLESYVQSIELCLTHFDFFYV
jgi:hypothetical protein